MHELMARSVLRPSPDGSGYELVCAPQNEANIYAQALTLNLWPKASEFGGPVKLIGCDPNFKGAPATGPANQALGLEGHYDYSFVEGTGHLLQAFFVLCRSEGIDPFSLQGSYAGAIGMARFVPSSINQYAIDFDGDGRIDLQGSAADAIGSVAHYLAQFGWERGTPARYEVAPPGDAAERGVLLEPDIVPTFSAEELESHGARLSDAGRATSGKLALVEVENGDGPPATSPAPPTSMRSRATTGRATTRWR